MPSAKHRTISKSGASRKSTTKGTSHQAESLSKTVPASFETIFGTSATTNPEATRTEKLIRASQQRLQVLTDGPVPPNRLLAARHRQRLWRERNHLKMLEEYLSSIK